MYRSSHSLHYHRDVQRCAMDITKYTVVYRDRLEVIQSCDLYCDCKELQLFATLRRKVCGHCTLQYTLWSKRHAIVSEGIIQCDNHTANQFGSLVLN